MYEFHTWAGVIIERLFVIFIITYTTSKSLDIKHVQIV